MVRFVQQLLLIILAVTTVAACTCGRHVGKNGPELEPPAAIDRKKENAITVKSSSGLTSPPGATDSVEQVATVTVEPNTGPEGFIKGLSGFLPNPLDNFKFPGDSQITAALGKGPENTFKGLQSNPANNIEQLARAVVNDAQAMAAGPKKAFESVIGTVDPMNIVGDTGAALSLNPVKTMSDALTSGAKKFENTLNDNFGLQVPTNLVEKSSKAIFNGATDDGPEGTIQTKSAKIGGEPVLKLSKTEPKQVSKDIFMSLVEFVKLLMSLALDSNRLSELENFLESWKSQLGESVSF